MLGLVRRQDYCDCCTAALLRGGQVSSSTDSDNTEDRDRDMVAEARAVIEVVGQLNRRKGITMVVAMLRGEKGCKSLSTVMESLQMLEVRVEASSIILSLSLAIHFDMLKSDRSMTLIEIQRVAECRL